MGYLTLSERQAAKDTEAFNALSVEVRKALEKKYPRKDTGHRQSMSSSRLGDVIEQATEFAASFKQDVNNVRIEHETEYNYGSEYTAIFLYVDAPETDAQYHKRLMDIHNWDMRREENDRAEFERLKSKFK